ncbi:MAG: hypothetical protein AAF559_10185 [Pseudomonadota bacterium]
MDRSSNFWRAGLAACALAFGGHAQAQDVRDTVNMRTEPVPEIEVVGERPIPRKAISKNIYELAQSNSVGTPIPRFHDPLCLSVLGLGETLNARVTTRIEDYAREASLEIANEGCTANALVLVVDRPEVLIERLRKRSPRQFTPRVKEEIRGALARKDPVIGWSQTAIRNRNGRSLTNAGGIPGAAGQLLGNLAFEYPVVDACIPSRVTICYSVARTVSFLVVDVRQLENVHINQLAAYSTMYLIGSPRRLLKHDKLTGASIMTLFEDGPLEAPIGLTSLDRAYLRGLYTLKPNENSARLAGSTKEAYAQITQASCEGDSADCRPDGG